MNPFRSALDWLGWERLSETRKRHEQIINNQKKIMATQAEIVADLKLAVEAQKKTLAEVKDAKVTLGTLKDKIVELEAIIAAGGTIGQELTDLVAEAKSLAIQTDEELPDLPVTPPPVEPAQ